jgi:hypothetical protein
MESLTLIREQIDYKQTKLDDRKAVVEEILEQTGDELSAYFNNSFKANLNSKDKLSHEDNVCRTLESLANYLLNSDEVKEEKAKEEFHYVFHTDEQYFNKKIQRENSIESMSSDSNEDTVIHFLIRSKKNYKKAKTQIVTKKDLQREGLVGEVLRAYNDELERISNKLKRENNDLGGKRYLLTRASGQIKTDMVMVKDQLLGTFGYNSNPSETTEYDLDLVDFTNPVHVKELITTFCDFEPDSDLAFVIAAFEELVDGTLLTPRERLVYNDIRQGLKNYELAEKFNVTQQWIGAIITSIAKKVAKEAEKYE